MCKEHASHFLYSMAASKEFSIIFWTPRGQLLRNKPIISATNITDLVECVHNDYVTKPSALKVFIDGLAEFVVDKGLINNERLDLIEKE